MYIMSIDLFYNPKRRNGSGGCRALRQVREAVC